MYRSQRAIAGLVVKVPGLSTSTASNHRTSIFGPTPRKFHLNTTPIYLDEGPCNTGESQHEPVVEIGKTQGVPKLSECGWGWTVTDDLDLG
jgi:hypothetical protein